MRTDNRFEELDKAALHNALLALKTCPNCRGDLLPIAFCAEVYGCRPCHETWHIPVTACACGSTKTHGEGALEYCSTCGSVRGSRSFP